MQRRDFITLLGAAAAMWPFAARAQQSNRVRRIGLLLPFSAHDPELQAELAVFKKGLQEAGWTEGSNVRLELRFTELSAEQIRIAAAELVATAPDVIFAYGNPTVGALRQTTQTIPIVFNHVSDPVGSGFVTNLAHPDANITGFHNFETAIGGKWLETLKQIAPEMRRTMVVYHPDVAANVAFFHAAEAASGSLGVKVTGAGLRNAGEIEPTLTAFAGEPNGGLIVAPYPLVIANRDRIIALTARLRLPTIYSFRYFPTNGGLVSYTSNRFEQWRGAASYIDRILRGTSPGELPIQLPTKYELVINLKTAKALGLVIPPTVLARADDVIE
jgi:putative ABC transport system substrate-binding protein